MPDVRILNYEDCRLQITKTCNNKNRIEIQPLMENLYVPNPVWETDYNLDIILDIIKIKTPLWVNNEIMREESPVYMQRTLKYGMLSYVTSESFKDKTILDFGCGSGSSSIILSKLLPDSIITGIDLVPEFIELAKKRTKFRSIKNVEYFVSPSSGDLSNNLIDYDYILLSGSFEHFLPDERKSLFIKIWDKLKTGGIMFLMDTPYRFFPLEIHTTEKLPFINYMPDKLTYWFVKKFSKRINYECSWENLLRNGIRGASVREILRILKSNNRKGILLKPMLLGTNDRIDVWYESYKDYSYQKFKKYLYRFSKFLKYISGLSITPYISIAVNKEK